MSKLINKIRTSNWAKRAAKLGGLYVAIEVILLIGALVFVGQSSL